MIQSIYVITGQTATGKTHFACNLAQKVNGELINCDSRQIYKKLTVITGKDLTGNPYHHIHTLGSFDIGYYTLGHPPQPARIWLYDIVDPKQHFSSFEYVQCALWVIRDIVKRGKTPIIVGGSYFYLRHLLYGLPVQPPPDWQGRASLATKPLEDLQDILKLKAPQIWQSLNRSDRHNPQRLIRKIEIAKAASQPEYPTQDKPPYHIILPEILAIPQVNVDITGLAYRTKNDLTQAIVSRVEERIRLGALDEVQQLLMEGYSPYDPGLKTIGYTQLLKHKADGLAQDKAVGEWTTKEIQYAKRQMTFMKKDPHIRWRLLPEA